MRGRQPRVDQRVPGIGSCLVSHHEWQNDKSGVITNPACLGVPGAAVQLKTALYFLVAPAGHCCCFFSRIARRVQH